MKEHDGAATVSNEQQAIPIIPLPREIKAGQGMLDLGGARLPAVNITFPAGLERAGALLHGMLEAITDGEITALNNTYGCETLPGISLVVDATLPGDTYRISIVDSIVLAGGSERALMQAIASLLQLLERPGPAGTPWRVPRCNIIDAPVFPYIGLLVDLARKWHPVHVIERCIRLCWWYKVRYLHLHFTDGQSYTLPSTAYPKLPTRSRHYTVAEIAALNTFARDHGVTIIPEIDLPGHSRAIVHVYPKLFGLKPFRLGRPVHDNVVNIGKDEAFDALARIIKETCGMFPDSPYFHLGADEVQYKALEPDPDVKKRVEKQQLGSVQELYREFIERMDDVVKSCGKQMCVWEGFGPSGKVPIPKDIPVFVFESLYNTADQLVADGYHVVNTSWQPIYVVPRKNWSPETIHAWHPRRWENWFERSKAFKNPIVIEPTPLLLGAQMCSWEQSAEQEIPALRARLAAFVDATWLGEKKRDYQAFAAALAVQDAKLDRVMQSTVRA